MQLHNLLSLSFGAKVRWRMKYQRNPLFVTLQDKYKVREYAKSKGVKTADLLYVTDQPENIPFAALPDQYMIKANHGCGWNILCYDSRFYLSGDSKSLRNEDGSLLNKNAAVDCELSEAAVIETCKKWLGSKYKKAEWAYQQIPPKIIVEKLLVPRDNPSLDDYDFYIFNGVVKAIFVGMPRLGNQRQGVFLDAEWNEIPRKQYNAPRPKQLPKMPACFPEMLAAAKKLSEEIDFARIDLYDTPEGIVLGEISIYPHGGNTLSPSCCMDFNKRLGHQWILSAADMRKAILLNMSFLLLEFGKTTKRKWFKA